MNDDKEYIYIVKVQVANPLQKTGSFSTETPIRTIIGENYTLESLSQFLRAVFDGFLSRLLWGRLGGVGLSQKSSKSRFLNCESPVIKTIAKVASLTFTVSRSTYNKLPHGL